MLKEMGERMERAATRESEIAGEREAKETELASKRALETERRTEEATAKHEVDEARYELFLLFACYL